jgi:hypothetical protein
VIFAKKKAADRANSQSYQQRLVQNARQAPSHLI